MQVKETIIKEIDLKKLMKAKGIKNINQLAKVAGVSVGHIYLAQLNHRVMGQATWNKIKVCL